MRNFTYFLLDRIITNFLNEDVVLLLIGHYWQNNWDAIAGDN
ncbi:hypothetical protein [Umezakia ovalisporum]|nr:hypothetical protein [Umezakia ovalisporum]MDH6090227.1 hypothetical protein [Umezakia ovalisporum Ak1311]